MTIVRAGSASTISARFEVDEEAVAVTTPLVGLVDDSGATILTPTAAGSPDADNVYSYLLPSAAITTPTVLAATWTGTYGGQTITVADVIDVAGGHYFDLGSLRAMPDVSNRYPTAKLARARDWITAKIDGTCHTSFVLRAHVATVTAATCHRTRGAALTVPRPYARTVRWLRLDGATVAANTLEILDGLIVAKAGQPNPFAGSWSTAEVGYTAGYSASCPIDLADPALIGARHHLLTKDGASGIPDRATSISNEFGNISMSTPGLRGAIVGIPEVDQAFTEWANRVRTWGIA